MPYIIAAIGVVALLIAVLLDLAARRGQGRHAAGGRASQAAAGGAPPVQRPQGPDRGAPGGAQGAAAAARTTQAPTAPSAPGAGTVPAGPGGSAPDADVPPAWIAEPDPPAASPAAPSPGSPRTRGAGWDTGGSTHDPDGADGAASAASAERPDGDDGTETAAGRAAAAAPGMPQPVAGGRPEPATARAEPPPQLVAPWSERREDPDEVDTGRGEPGSQAAPREAPAWTSAAADLLRALARLPGVRGWAIVGQEGAVVAADPSMHAAIIASGGDIGRTATAVAARLRFGAWQTVELRGPAGSLQAVAGPEGWSLLALLGPEGDRDRVRAEGTRVLARLAGDPEDDGEPAADAETPGASEPGRPTDGGRADPGLDRPPL